MNAGKIATWMGIGTGVGAVAILGAPFLGAAAMVGLSTAVTTWTIGAVGTAMGVGGVAGAALAGASAIGHDLVLSNFRGKVVQVLGPNRVGKNSLYDFLTKQDSSERYDPTTISTDSLYGKNSKTRLKILEDEDVPLGFFKDIYELSGENVKSWKTRIEETNPHGIIYIVTSTTEYRGCSNQNDRFEKEVNGLEEIADTLKILRKNNGTLRLKSFLILVNKIDLLIKSKPIDKNNISDEYLQKLREHNTNIYQLLKDAVGEKTPITVDYFCLDSGQRYNSLYLIHNIKVIKEFWKKIV